MERINLSQLRKCDQRWEEMTPSAKGRICGQCNKHIVDFRKMTHAEVAKEHAFSEEAVCGLYTPEQLMLIKRPTRKGRVNKRLSLFLASMALLFSEQVDAQEPVPKERTIAREDLEKLPARSGPLDHGPKFQDTILVTGTVLDENNTPLPFVTVHVQGTKLGTTTDFDGNYTLGVPVDARSEEDVMLVFKYVGYDTKTFNFGRLMSVPKEPIVVNMEFTEQSVVAFGVTIGSSRRAGLWAELRKIFGRRYH